MSTRSATNKRTQSHEVTGVARKSAASAKPARQAASSVRVVPASSKARRKELEKGENLEGLSKEEKRARKAKQRAKEDRIYTVSNILLKQDEDYTKRRRIWWAVLAIGMVLVVAIWASLYFAPAGMVSSPVQMVGIVLLTSSFWVTLSTTLFVFVPCATCTARRPRACPRTSSTPLSSARLPRRTRRTLRRSSVCMHTYR